MLKIKWLAAFIAASVLLQAIHAQALENSSLLITYSLDDSVNQFGYTPHFNVAADAWSHIDTNVKVSQTKFDGAKRDIFYVGTTRISGLLGATVAYNKNLLGRYVPSDDMDNADLHTVVLYHNNFEKYQLTFRERVSTAIHEIGHTLGLKHPATVEPSVMRQGIQDLLPTAYDRYSVKSLLSSDVAYVPSGRKISVSANYESYLKVSDIDKDADLILKARPSEAFDKRESHINYFSSGDVREFYTLTNLKIEKVLKGDLKNFKKNTLSVIEPIAKDKNSGLMLTYEDYQAMSENESYLIFLKKNDYGQWSIINMSLGAIPVNPPQMLFKAAPPTEGDASIFESKAMAAPEDTFATEALNYYLK